MSIIIALTVGIALLFSFLIYYLILGIKNISKDTKLWENLSNFLENRGISDIEDSISNKAVAK